MKCNALKKVLIGVLTVTTVFSTLGSSVARAGEFDGVEEAIVSVSQEQNEADDLISTFLSENSEDESPVDEASFGVSSVSATDETEDAASTGSTVSETAGSSDGVSVDTAVAAGSDASTDTVVAPGTSASTDETDTVSSADASTLDSSSASDASSEASSDASAEASSGASLDDETKTKKSLKRGSSSLLGASTSANDLKNPDFGEVTNLVLPDHIDAWDEEFTLGFSFKVYNAETIPGGQFTYTLPKELDFTAIIGTTIVVKGEGGKQIGTASVGSDNVITFTIDESYLQTKPNGIKGSVELSCKIDTSHGGEDDTIKIIFSDETSIEIKVRDSVVTAQKDPIKLSNGKGTFKVKFEVNTDTENLVIIDTLGEDLVHTAGSRWFWNTSTYKVPAGTTFELVDERTLKVTIPFIEAGVYSLGYEVAAVENAASTANKTPEELIEGSTRNTVQWTWDGSKNDHIVKSYATIPSQVWIRKNGTNGQQNGSVNAKGYCEWIVYINSGGYISDVKGMVFKDVLSKGMVFCQEGMVIQRSSDGKSWKNIYPLSAENFSVNEAGQSVLTFTFPSDAPASLYRLKYESKIDGTFPTTKTSYSNTATISLDGEVIGTITARNTYDHVGAFTATVSKEPLNVENPRDGQTGLVQWKTVFYVQGDNNNFKVELNDIIEPNDAAKVINGKVVGADAVADSVKIYHADDNGNPQGEPLNAEVKYNGNSFTAKLKGVKSGTYVMIYSTQDYYGDKNNHEFPEGYNITFINKVSMTIDGESIDDSYSYDVESHGLPMLKEALPGYYDSAAGTFAIPWKIYINRNTLGQTNESLKSGDKAKVTDYLPKELSYKPGSAVITRNDGTTFKLEPEVTTASDGSGTLGWKFDWQKEASVSGSNNYYIIDFITYVDKAFFEKVKEVDGDGTIHLSFQNNVVGGVGDNKGSTNTSSNDEITFLAKKAEINNKTQLVEYSVTINKECCDLMENSDELKLTDDLTNGTFVTGSLKVYHYGTETEYVLPADKIETADDGSKFTITIPDETALVVKYSVKPNAKQGEAISETQTQVKVSNIATLYGDGNKSSEWTKKYTVDTVSADITSDKGSVTITKVDAENLFKGLAGAEIALYRVDLGTEKESLVATKTTVADEFSVTFSTDGKYDSLIFDTLYFYTETKAPENYELDTSKYYFIFKGTKYEKVKNSVEKYIKDQGVKADHYMVLDPSDLLGGKYETKLNNEKIDKASIKVTKVDSADVSKGLIGAEITLFRTNVSTGAETKVAAGTTAGNDYSVTFSSDGTNDSLLLDTLYYYTETIAPKGYERDDSKYYFIFKGKKYNIVKNSVEKYIADQGIKADHFVVLDPKTLEEGRFGVNLLNEKSDTALITVKKVDAADTSKGLAGAEISLFRTDVSTGAETKVDAKTTAANDYTVTFSSDEASDSLLLDTLYYYTETKAPDGYELDNSKYYFIFKGKKYDSVKSAVDKYIADQGVKADHYIVLDPKTLSEGKYGATLFNEKIEKVLISVTKVDSEDQSKGLAGAEISLFRTNVNTGVEIKVDAKTTAANDYTVTFSSDEASDSLLLDTLYYYTETKAPDGYELDNSKYYFIFKGKKYDSVKSAVDKYIADQGVKADHYIVLDPKTLSEGKYGATLLDVKKKVEKALITVTKVDSANRSRGLAGAEITLFRTNVGTGAETKVESKTTSANNYSVTFSSDEASDSLLFDTLYFYMETRAPEGYELDNSKYYFIFKGKNYDSIKSFVDKYIADQGVNSDHYVVLDPNRLYQGGYGAVLLNRSKPDEPPEEPPSPPEEPPSPPTPPIQTVLGARRETPKAAVLGARRSRTEDSNMNFTYMAILAAIAGLMLLFKKREDEE